jgi:hypothetical protein
MPDPKITQEQAAAALKDVLEGHLDENEQPQTTTVTAGAAEETPAETPEAAESAPAEVVAGAADEPAETPAAEDDLESLKKRLADREAQDAERKKLDDSRWKAMQDRASENERILRERLLRKSAAADRARQVLQRSKTQEGVTQDEVDQVIQDIQGTLNPASANYVPPPAQAEDNEDKAIVLNRFLNEKNMTIEEQEEFGRWIQTDGSRVLTPAEQAVAYQSLDGFLRLAHRSWQETTREAVRATQRAETVNAVKSIQKTQKEAARAASAPATAPRKQPIAGSKELNLHKLPQKERDAAISALVRASVEQYR